MKKKKKKNDDGIATEKRTKGEDDEERPAVNTYEVQTCSSAVLMVSMVLR